MDHNQLLERIKTDIQYAEISFSLELMYKVYGKVEAYAECRVITSTEYCEIAGMMCREFFNNARWTTACEIWTTSPGVIKARYEEYRKLHPVNYRFIDGGKVTFESSEV